MRFVDWQDYSFALIQVISVARDENLAFPIHNVYKCIERSSNVRGAFVYSGRGVENGAVVLIDDVYTSGATVDECARVLKRSGAKRVDVLTVARTI